MVLKHYLNGQYAALHKLGTLQLYAPATHESGRLRGRTNEDPKTQVNTTFNEFDRAFDRDAASESSQFSVGSGQSTINKTAHATNTGSPLFQRILQEVQSHKDLQPVRIPHSNPLANWGYLPANSSGKNKAQLIINPSNNNPYFLAHELGHHKWSKNPLGKILQHPIANKMSETYPKVIPLMVGISFGLGAGKSLKGQAKTDAMDDARLKATAIASLPLAPRYISETAANVHGTRTFAKHYMQLKPSQRSLKILGKGLGSLLLSQGSYTLGYGTPLIAAAGISAWHKRHREHHK